MLDTSLQYYYKYQIDGLRWMANIGRIDINTEISRFKYQFSMPREVHSDDLLQVYAYLNQKYNSILGSV